MFDITGYVSPPMWCVSPYTYFTSPALLFTVISFILNDLAFTLSIHTSAVLPHHFTSCRYSRSLYSCNAGSVASLSGFTTSMSCKCSLQLISLPLIAYCIICNITFLLTCKRMSLHLIHATFHPIEFHPACAHQLHQSPQHLPQIHVITFP